jgi:menaquinone-dependent protoporphyrinogen oxidase
MIDIKSDAHSHGRPELTDCLPGNVSDEEIAEFIDVCFGTRAAPLRQEVNMKPVGVLYATREGQTQRIAEYIASRLRAHGFAADVGNLKNDAGFDLSAYSAVVLAASVHAGQHEAEMLEFVRRYRHKLETLTTAFISVTLSEAGVERANATPDERAGFGADVRKVADVFFYETGWRPTHFKPVAGALLYTKYNFFMRFIMKRIARKAGAETDTSRDYEYTDWSALGVFIDELCAEMSGEAMPKTA